MGLDYGALARYSLAALRTLYEQYSRDGDRQACAAIHAEERRRKADPANRPAKRGRKERR